MLTTKEMRLQHEKKCDNCIKGFVVTFFGLLKLCKRYFPLWMFMLQKLEVTLIIIETIYVFEWSKIDHPGYPNQLKL